MALTPVQLAKLMQPQHRDWQTFQSFLNGALAQYGCDGAMNHAIGLLIWLGADWLQSTELFRECGAQCDCQIIARMLAAKDEKRPESEDEKGVVAADTPDDDDDPVKRAQDTLIRQVRGRPRPRVG
jgi:hypothetical protein